MSSEDLNTAFAIPNVLRFEETNGLTRAVITSPAAEATVYLQGAHITHWQPAGHTPVLFLSGRSDLAPGKPIRGGVPVCFPWFAVRHDGRQGPSHGFARIQPWDLVFAAMAGETLHLTFTLGATELSRSLGFDNFRLAYKLAIGPTLTAQLTVANTGSAPLVIEQALHTYYRVHDIHQVSVDGLGGRSYIDKTDANHLKKLPEGPLRFAGQTDRVFPGTQATCILHDAAARRLITVEKTGSSTTVVWNPWSELAARLPDMDPDGWQFMAAIETANAGPDTLTLAPGAMHAMQFTASVALDVAANPAADPA